MVKPIVVEYKNTFENVFEAARTAVSTCGYSIGSEDKDTWILTYEVGIWMGIIACDIGSSVPSWVGQKMSILIMELRNGRINVYIGGAVESSCAQVQQYDWEAAAQIGIKIVKQIDAVIGKGKVLAGGTTKDGCFIATAVYGDYNHPSVRVLRSFRDRTLARSMLGLTVIKVYYACGPTAAKLIQRSHLLTHLVKAFLDRIVIRLQYNTYFHEDR